MTGHDIPSNSIRLTTPKDSRTGILRYASSANILQNTQMLKTNVFTTLIFYAIIRNSVYACARFASDSVHSAARIDKQMFNY